MGNKAAERMIAGWRAQGLSDKQIRKLCFDRADEARGLIINKQIKPQKIALYEQFERDIIRLAPETGE